VRAFAERLPPRAWKTLPCRMTPAVRRRVVAAHPVRRDGKQPREAWLIIEWPQAMRHRATTGSESAAGYAAEAARPARLRWTIELGYRQVKGELGLDHFEGRSYLGFHHHCALVTCAHAS
jgi:hypothetical protein